MRIQTKCFLLLLVALPLIWFSFNQQVNLSQNRKDETDWREKNERVSISISRLKQLDSEMPLLRNENRQSMGDVKQMVFLFDKQGLPVPSDDFPDRSIMMVNDGANSSLNIKLYLPPETQAELLVMKVVSQAANQGIAFSKDNLLKIKFEKPGWHSISAKLEKSETGSRIPLLVDGNEEHSIDLGALKSASGGSSYSPGALPNVIPLNTSDKTVHHSINYSWELAYIEKSARVNFGYRVASLSVSPRQPAKAP